MQYMKYILTGLEGAYLQYMKYISKEPPESVFVSIPYFPARMLLSNGHRRGTRCLQGDDEFDDHLDGADYAGIVSI